MKRASLWLKLGVVSAIVASNVGSAQAAGLFESIRGREAAQADSNGAQAKRRIWRIREFSTVQLLAREAGAPENQHPVKLNVDALRLALGQFKSVDMRGKQQALFDAEELVEISEPIAQAFANAEPGDDVLLVSSARREGFLAPPTAVTARLFIEGGNLNFIAHDTGFDFVHIVRSTSMSPNFIYGTRGKASDVKLASAGASNRRADWLTVSLTQATTAPVQPPPPPMVLVAPPPAAATTFATPPAAPPVVAAPVPAPAAPIVQPADAKADEIERRLNALKQLRDKGLITDDEYKQKRKEILQSL
ncbi:SHOCT domain-containing protein [Rhizobacter sp. P5_C2]